ncbi:hypothetical protein [Streptomyces sp. NPDC045251]|uniref:hypothetical protein n=1 Tax=unclassified Streptomyces TaxID=2593676 RepID=UPI0034004F36
MDWEQIERTTGLAFPADYRELVELYGGGEIDEYLSVSTPPVPGSPYGDLLDRGEPALSERDREELGALLPGGALPPLLSFADSASSDVAFWLREGAPDDWRGGCLPEADIARDEPLDRVRRRSGSFVRGGSDRRRAPVQRTALNERRA